MLVLTLFVTIHTKQNKQPQQEYNRGVFDYLIATDESMDTACGGGAGGKKRRRSDSGSESEEIEGGEGKEQVEEEQHGDKWNGKKGKREAKAAENEDEKGA